RTRDTAVKGRCLNHLTNGPFQYYVWRRARDLNPRGHVNGLHDFQSCSFGQLGQLSMAPQVGFEPTTDRLTADCSTTELLWNKLKSSSRSNVHFHIMKFHFKNHYFDTNKSYK